MGKVNSWLYLTIKYFRQNFFLPCHKSREVLNNCLAQKHVNECKLLGEKKIPLLSLTLT